MIFYDDSVAYYSQCGGVGFHVDGCFEVMEDAPVTPVDVLHYAVVYG